MRRSGELPQRAYRTSEIPKQNKRETILENFLLLTVEYVYVMYNHVFMHRQAYSCVFTMQCLVHKVGAPLSLAFALLLLGPPAGSG